jgi:hypothetical protein
VWDFFLFTRRVAIGCAILLGLWALLLFAPPFSSPEEATGFFAEGVELVGYALTYSLLINAFWGLIFGARELKKEKLASVYEYWEIYTPAMLTAILIIPPLKRRWLATRERLAREAWLREHLCRRERAVFSADDVGKCEVIHLANILRRCEWDYHIITALVSEANSVIAELGEDERVNPNWPMLAEGVRTYLLGVARETRDKVEMHLAFLDLRKGDAANRALAKLLARIKGKFRKLTVDEVAQNLIKVQGKIATLTGITVSEDPEVAFAQLCHMLNVAEESTEG